MPSRRAAPIRRPLSLTSLIDVVFLLLLFFMLSSTFSRQAEISLTSAAGGGTPGSAAPVFLRLSADSILLNGVPTDGLSLAQDIRVLTGAKGFGPDTPVLLSTGPDVSAQRLVDVLTLLTGLPVQVLG